MAFQDYKIIGKSVFVGVDNFGNLIVDSYWWASIWNAFRYSMLVISLTFLPPMILAILLQEVPKGKMLFRMIYLCVHILHYNFSPSCIAVNLMMDYLH